MSHECPYCGAELVWEDSFGKGNQAAQEKYGYGWQKIGNIYRCPNHQGFNDEEKAIDYITREGCYDGFFQIHFEWEDIICESNIHHVSGSFYDYGEGTELHNGYPC